MLFHIIKRAEFPFLFASPQSDAYRSPRLDLERIEDAHDLHRNHSSGPVVGRASRSGPRIQMSSEHDYFVLQLRIGPRDLRNSVKTVLMVAGELYIDIQFDRDRNISLEQPVDAPITLDRHNDYGNRLRVLPLIDEPSQTAAAVIENSPSGTAALAAIAARENHCERMLRDQQLHGLLAQ